MNRQSYNIKNRNTTAAIYPRLSRDDGIDGDSNSIANQKKLLTKVAKEKGYTNILTFVDDGISGVTMNRPGFVDFLEQVILQEIRRLTRFASRNEDDFVRAVMGFLQQADLDSRQRKQKELYALNARDRELDTMFNRMYEDNINGKIDDARFAKMSAQYTAEQKELAEKIRAIVATLDKQETKALTADMFIATVRKYTRAKKLTERMLNELIDRIEVFQSEKVNGVHVQRLNIYYNCVGIIEIPQTLPLPEIAMRTRKGVTVAYQPQHQVI